ncbi:hypothetical protein chiPu_0020672, partial [Chiloscyllium punctatum]|nr:hypothetical protein [Chiloscyllium punctatum]
TGSTNRDRQMEQDQLKSALDSMEAEKESKSELKQQQEREIAELDEFTTSLEKDISAQFARIHQYLEDKEKCFVEELMRQKEEALQLMVENQSRTEMELFSLEENILNLKEVIQQQDNIYFLKELQGLQEMYLDKGEEGRNADGGQDEEDNDVIQDLEEYVFEEIAYPTGEGEEMQISPRKNYTGFQGPLLYAVWKEMKQIISPFPVSLTLDPNTAHHNLILSEDLTSVRNSETVLELPDNPERFDTAPCVLGSQGFNSGKHYWEVEVGDNTDWDVGVVREFANRKGCVITGPENGYWAVWLRNENKYGAAIDSLCPSVKPRSIGVYLDYEGGLVTFYNADDMSVLYTFTDTFTEKLFPYFYPGLHDVGKNNAPLRLCCF